MAQGGPFPDLDPDEEAYIQANAHILPVVVARVCKPHVRRSLIQKISNAKSENTWKRDYPTEDYDDTDETFIQEHLHLSKLFILQ